MSRLFMWFDPNCCICHGVAILFKYSDPTIVDKDGKTTIEIGYCTCVKLEIKEDAKI